MDQTSAPSPQRGRYSQSRFWGEAVALAPEDGLLAWSRYRLSPRGSGQPPPPSHGSWETAETELSGGREKNEA